LKIQAKVRSTTQRRGNTSKPVADAAADDLEGDVGLVGGPLDETASVAAVGEDAGDEGVALARALERQLAAVAILDVGTMDADSEEPTIGVGQDVALAPGDLLARVVALFAPF
jgi:hypothetical protein